MIFQHIQFYLLNYKLPPAYNYLRNHWPTFFSSNIVFTETAVLPSKSQTQTLNPEPYSHFPPYNPIHNTLRMQPTKPPLLKTLKILALSDTHGQLSSVNCQSGDLLLFAGDFTAYCNEQHILDFVATLDRLSFRYKVVICGNHELGFDGDVDVRWKEKRRCASQKTPEELKKLLKKHCIYLEHEMVEIEGVRIFGSPYVKKHGQTAFGYRDGSKVWADIPPVDILMTHGPPYGIADIAKENKRVGCEFLLEKVMEIRPKFHIFGHIHESGGQMVEKNGIVFANVSQCGSHRKLTYKPFKFEIAVNGSDRQPPKL